MPEESGEKLKQDVSRDLKRSGFEAGESVFSFIPCFTLEDVREAQFRNTYDEPKPVRIGLSDSIVFNVVVQLVKSVFVGVKYSNTDNPLGCYKYPDWYIEGWLLKSGFDPYDEIVRIRMYVRVNSGGEFENAFIQRIPKNSDPEGVIELIENP